MFDPMSYPPTILHPTADVWEVEIRIHSAANSDHPPSTISQHPMTELLMLARIIESTMNYTEQFPVSQMMVMEHGVIIRSPRDGAEIREGSTTIASCMLQIPIHIICWDNVLEA